MKTFEQFTEGSLHKWFKGSKSKDGKPGWVNVKTGGTCASDEPGEGTPKCVSSSKRASMTKAERESASRRKKAADPNQQQKSGAAKPTYVATDKKKEKVDEACWKGYKAYGMKKKGGKMVPNCKPVGSVKKEEKGYQPEIEHSKLGDAKKKADKKRESKLPPHLQGDAIGKMRKAFASEGAAWTKKSGKNPEGGLNEKGRKSYERENPGSDLKAPQPEGGSRKKSFCARMGGMKKKLTSKKTANDPDSRINKALRKWKCNEEDKAFNFVVNKLKAKYGSGVMTKGDKMPEPSAAQKKKNAAIRAKRAKEDHRDPTEKASDGRYSDRYSNRGSD